MTVPTKERQKSQHKEEDVNPPKKGFWGRFVDDFNDIAEKRGSPPIDASDKFIMLIFGLFLLGSFIFAVGWLYLQIISGVDGCSDQARRMSAGVFLMVIACTMTLYCFFRDFYDAKLKTLSTRLISVFIQVASWQDNSVQILSNSLKVIQFTVMMSLVQWSLVTLFYGADISANIGSKLWTFDGNNETMGINSWIATHRAIVGACCGTDKILPLWFIVLIVSGICFGKYDEQSTAKLPKNSPLWWSFGKVYGEGQINLFFHYTLHYPILIHTFAIFPSLSGEITREYLKSLNWFYLFTMFTVPTYLVFLAVCVTMELFIYYVHPDRNEPKKTAQTDAESEHVSAESTLQNL